MKSSYVDDAIELLEKANADLSPELLSGPAARKLLAAYARAQRLAAFGIATLARKLDDATEFARTTGTSIGQAKDTIATGKTLGDSGVLSDAMAHGDISLDQASAIAVAERAAPGAASELLDVARDQAFQVLRDKARKVKLEAEQHRDLFERQRAARSARSYRDELGMVHVHLAWEPHVATPIVNRAEAQAMRMSRAASKNDQAESFERHLADAYASLLAGRTMGRAQRPELVVLVSHGVAKRGWRDVTGDEVCKIPGVGPVAPEVAREIAGDAFLTGLFYDGTDLRHMKRWTRNIPVEVRLALELGPPPDFDGVRCVDCGNRFTIEKDHDEPHVAHGPASSGNMKPRCGPCHKDKTERDRRAGKLTPGEP